MITRLCPLCNDGSARFAGSITAEQIVAANETYRRDAAEILGIAPSTPFSFSRCNACDFLFVTDRPDASFLNRVYCAVIDPVIAREESNRPFWTGHQLRLAGGILERCASRGPRILDYGCGDATVVRALNAAGTSCFGFDPYARPSHEELGEMIFRSFEAVAADAPFDGVLLSDVLEHVPEPLELLREVHSVLGSEAVICVSVPDFNDARANELLESASRGKLVTRELNPWEHLNYFTPRSLSHALTQSGFVPETEPVSEFGLRHEAGIRRLLNLGKSVGRMLQYALAPFAGTTTIYARRS